MKINESITFKPIEGTIARAEGFIEDCMEKAEVPLKYATKVNICMDEIYSNVVNYSGALEAIVTIMYDDETVTLICVDDGMEYNPLEREDPDTTLSVDDREIGGLGILITKKLMDNITYARENGRNILTMSIKVS